MQRFLFSKIQSLLPANKSLIEEIADILDINYDAAYRRINDKAKLSLEDAVKLAKHYNLSLNTLYEVGSPSTIIADVSPAINNMEGLENYFKASLSNIKKLISLKDASIIYSAKDIPLFYTLKSSYITKYKCYVWLKFLDEDGSMSRISFKTFLEECPSSLFSAAEELGETYDYIDIVEFWNDNTINGTLEQIRYYFETGNLQKEMALLICEDLNKIVDHVQKQCSSQLIVGSKNKASYNLYKSDLLTMSNTIMVKAGKSKVFFTPFTVLTYLKIEHSDTCKRLNQFFEKQKNNSKLLVHAGEKDRSQFFHKMRLKIKTLKKYIFSYEHDNLF